MEISRRSALIMVAGTGLAACEQKAAVQTAPGPDDATTYRAPPTVIDAEAVSGGVRLRGLATPASTVRLRAPEGDRFEVAAGADGGWAVNLPIGAAPRLFALEAEHGGRVLRGEGALAVLSTPTPRALILRAGYAADIAGSGPPGELRLVALDYNGGGLAVAGFAPANTAVGLLVDGVPVGVGQADRRGRLTILSVDSAHHMALGAHRVALQTKTGLRVERSVIVATPRLAAGSAYKAVEAPGGWAITWALPGGGAETCQVFDDAVARVRL